MTKQKRTSFVFYDGFYEAIQELETAEEKVELLDAICTYELTGEIPEMSYACRVAFKIIKKSLDTATTRYLASVENGKKGGRPKKEENIGEPTGTYNNLGEPTGTYNNLGEPTGTQGNHNVNDNVNGNVNESGNENESEKLYTGETSSPSNPSTSSEDKFSEETTLTNCPDPSDKAEKYSAEINEIVAYLNEKTQSSYRTSTANTRKHIVARLKQCYTVADFKHVIDVKCAEWLNDPKMAQYLRPETLFTERNFENYLQQKMQVNKNGTPQVNQRKARVEDLSDLVF